MRKAISTEGAPAPVAPYSPGIKAGEMIFLSGQLGLDADTGHLVPGGAREQAEKALSNIAALATAAGGSMDDVVKTTVFMADLAEFGSINELFAKSFDHPRPARSAVEVSALPLGALVEIEAILCRGSHN